MRPSLNTRYYKPRLRTAPSVKRDDRLDFRRLTMDDIDRVGRLLALAKGRTNDYTIGGIYMWRQYFDYSFDIIDNTLFIKGVDENDLTRTAFMLPVGEMPAARAVDQLRRYRDEHQLPSLVLSAVPEDGLRLLGDDVIDEVAELTDWADYLYDGSALVSLSGKKLSKKRNHVNRFKSDNPGFSFEPLTSANIDSVKEFVGGLELDPSKPALAEFEMARVADVLDMFERYPFEGGVLTTPDDGVVAFGIGEVVGDTLFVHIEKINHLVSGAGETINNLFATMMTDKYPAISYINREEDAGDPGLRRAKESYHPLRLLRKYNVTLR